MKETRNDRTAKTFRHLRMVSRGFVFWSVLTLLPAFSHVALGAPESPAAPQANANHRNREYAANHGAGGDGGDDGNAQGASAGAAITYRGVHLLLAADLQIGASDFFFGPQISLTEGYFPHRVRWGGHAGWRYRISRNDWRFAVGSEYHFLTPQPTIRSWVHEVFLTYGLELRIAEGLRLGSTIGQGVLLEFVPSAEGYRNVSLDGLLKLYIRYDI